jgi:hypothetical protein
MSKLGFPSEQAIGYYYGLAMTLFIIGYPLYQGVKFLYLH